MNQKMIDAAIIHLLQYKNTGDLEALKTSQRLTALLIKQTEVDQWYPVHA